MTLMTQNNFAISQTAYLLRVRLILASRPLLEIHSYLCNYKKKDEQSDHKCKMCGTGK